MHTDKNPKQQIESGNKWFIDDHFSKQYARAGPRAVIEARWRVFESAISEYLKKLSSLEAQNPTRILDAGCGDGINLLGLSQIVDRNRWNAEILGVDYNPLRIRRVTKFKHVSSVCESRLESLPYPDGSFSIVICNQVLEHIPDESAALRELRRVLSDGGLLIVGVPNEGCVLARLRNNVFQRMILRTTDHVNFHTEETLTRVLAGERFSAPKIIRTGFFMPHLVLQYGISSFSAGRALLGFLGKVLPSQCAELMVIAEKSFATRQDDQNPVRIS